MNIITSNGKFIVKLAVTLLVITAVVALLLAGVNELTADTIAAREAEKRNAAMLAVMPDTTIDETKTVVNEDSTVYYAMKGSEFEGFCVQVAPNGFGGEISMIVGVDKELRVTGVSIVSMSETAGIGTKAKEPEFLAQYNGLTTGVTLGGGENGIDAITGSTVTSKAVTLGVNTALAAAADAINIGE